MKYSIVWTIVLMMCVLAACGQADVSVEVMEPAGATARYQQQATQTPDANNRLYYEHTQTGMFLLYPAGWQVAEQPGTITVSDGNLRLIIQYMMLAPEESIATSGDASLVERGAVQLLGDTHPVYVDEDAKRIHYTPPHFADSEQSAASMPFVVSNVGFAIYLDSVDWPVSEAEDRVIRDMVESFGFIWLTTRPSQAQLQNWIQYQDETTGLQFYYPADWRVESDSETICVYGPGVVLALSSGSGPGGLPAGDLRKGDPSNVWINGQAIPRVELVFEARIKAVYYGEPGTRFSINDTQLTVIVSDSGQQMYEAVDLPADALRQIDWILTTLEP